MLPFKTFLTVMAQYCQESDIGWCYARHYTTDMFTAPQRDIDIITDKRHVKDFITLIAIWPNLKLVGQVEHANNTQLYIYGVRQGEQNFICLDIHHTLALKGLDYLKPSAVILKAVPAENEIGLQPNQIDMALIYIFTHILKHYNTSEHVVSVINTAYQTARTQLIDLLTVYFDEHASPRLTAITDNKNVKKNIRLLRSAYFKRHVQQDRFTFWVNRLTYNMKIILQRMFHRQDVRLVIMGTDGSGKTHFINQLKPLLEFLRPNLLHAHVTPPLPWQLEVDSNRINAQPHAKPNRGWIISNAKLLYFCAIYWIDAFWPHRGSRIILYDRYFTDLLIDPKRFRFGGSTRFALFIQKHLPPVHGVIWLSTPPVIAYKRKPELPLQLMQLQYDAYKQLSASYPYAHALDGTRINPDDLNQTLSFIADALQKQLVQA